MSNSVSSIFAVSFFTAILTSALVTGGMLYFTGNLKLPDDQSQTADKEGVQKPDTIEAPSLVGLTTPVAADVLQARSLRLVVQEERPDNTMAAGKICSQDPLPNSVLMPGGEVAVVVSTGPAEAPVPNVVGKPMEEAKKLIADAGLKVGNITESETGDPGTVVSTSPEAGATVEPNAAVDIAVAKGITVPKVVGFYFGRGKKELKDAGLKVGKPKWRYSDNFDVNIILEQAPEAGTIVAGNTEIILTVNPD
ncbi:MAG: PASTA domain-containing protein [Deltaproteobacteria bacterium]|nr:PASTA domain-containing protein [Deltaproteobacteria bacterium]